MFDKGASGIYYNLKENLFVGEHIYPYVQIWFLKGIDIQDTILSNDYSQLDEEYVRCNL